MQMDERSCKKPRALDSHQQDVLGAELGSDLCVLAGAGTGKTQTIVQRIQRLTQHGWTVRCFSHANKTCDELRARH